MLRGALSLEMKMSILWSASGVDVDVDRDILANPGNCFGRRTKHQAKVTPFEGLGRDLPVRLFEIASGRAQKFYVECYGACHAVHGEVASDIAGLRAGLFNAVTLECNLRELRDIEKLRAAQVIVTFGNARVDAANGDPSGD